MKVEMLDRGIAVVSPRGYLADEQQINDFADTIAKLTEDGNRYLVVDCREVQHMNSRALGELISTHSSYVRRSGRMVLASVDRRIETIFVITKLSLVFDFFTTRELAVASFPQPTPA